MCMLTELNKRSADGIKGSVYTFTITNTFCDRTFCRHTCTIFSYLQCKEYNRKIKKKYWSHIWLENLCAYFNQMLPLPFSTIKHFSTIIIASKSHICTVLSKYETPLLNSCISKQVNKQQYKFYHELCLFVKNARLS